MKAVAKTVEPAAREAPLDHIRPAYLEALTLVERLHRRLLDVIKDEFDRRGRSDINSVQALLLYNIGDKELTAGELRTRGYYLGSNVSYNLKKLVEMAFLDHQRSRVDRRSVRIKLTDKGREVRDIIETLYQKHVRTVEQVGGINAEEFSTLNKSLHRLERFWTDQILYRLYFDCGWIDLPRPAGRGFLLGCRKSRSGALDVGPAVLHSPMLGGWQAICYCRTQSQILPGRMIFSENRLPLFGIMRFPKDRRRPCPAPGDCDVGDLEPQANKRRGGIVLGRLGRG